MKKYSLFILLIYVLGCLKAQNVEELDRRYGFRELKFGMNIDTLLSNSVIRQSKKNGKLFEKHAEDLVVDGCMVESIEYESCKNIFCGVLITAPLDMFFCLKNRLEARYGFPVFKNYEKGIWRYWWLGEEVGLCLRLENKSCSVQIWSKKIYKQGPENQQGGVIRDF
jgi:hypothetical protein